MKKYSYIENTQYFVNNQDVNENFDQLDESLKLQNTLKLITEIFKFEKV